MYDKFGFYIFASLLLLVLTSCNYDSDMNDIGLVDVSLSRPIFQPESGTTFTNYLSVEILDEDSNANIFYWRENEMPKDLNFFKESYSLFEAKNPDVCEDSFNMFSKFKENPDMINNIMENIENFNDCRAILLGIQNSEFFDSYILEKPNIESETFNYCVNALNFSNLSLNAAELKSVIDSINLNSLSDCFVFFGELKKSINEEFSNHIYKKPITIYNSEIIFASAYKDGQWSNGLSSAIYERDGEKKDDYSDSFIEFTSPHNNDYYNLNEKIFFEAISTFQSETDRIEFYKDGELFKIDTVAPYSFDWSSNVSGNFLFEAKGYSSDGLNSSDFVNVRVNTDLYVDLSADSWSVLQGDNFKISCDSGDSNAEVTLTIDDVLVEKDKEKIEYSSTKPVGNYAVKCNVEKGKLSISSDKELIVYSLVGNNENQTNNSSFNDSKDIVKDKDSDKDKDTEEISSFNISVNFSELSDEELLNISNLSLISNYVEVDFTEALNLSKNLSLNNGVVFRKHSVFINSSLLPELNKKAHIVFANVNYEHPIPLKNGYVCGYNECYNMHFDKSSGTYEMDVAGFSEYSLTNFVAHGGRTNLKFVPVPDDEGECIPFWQCFSLTDCVDGYVQRDCFDSHQCNVEEGRPASKVTCDEAEKFIEHQRAESVKLLNKDYSTNKEVNTANFKENNIDSSQEFIKEDVERETSSNTWLFVILGSFILVIISVLLFFFLIKKPKTYTLNSKNDDFGKMNISPEFEKKCFDYVEKMRGLGYDDDFIREKMSASGYSEDIIEYLFYKLDK